MALTELVIPPDQSAYSVTDGNEVIGVKLDGGASRYRRDILGATSRVAVQWTVGPEQYEYLRMFYRAVTTSGSLPFNIGLILDEAALTTHKAYFLPGTMALRQQMGLTYIVGAELEVYPNEIPANAADYIYLYNEFGTQWRTLFPISEDILDVIINQDLPGIF